MRGYAASASLLGQPDVSLLTMTEIIDCYRRVVDAVDIPVFVDGDTGYGGILNVRRTVMEIERTGAAGIFIEDQVFPSDAATWKAMGIFGLSILHGSPGIRIYERGSGALSHVGGPGDLILSRSGLGEEMYELSSKWLGWMPGGLGVATCITGGILAAMIGSSIAVTAIVTLVMMFLIEPSYPAAMRV